MNRLCLFSAVLFLFSGIFRVSLWAGPVGLEPAREKARAFYLAQKASASPKEMVDFHLVYPDSSGVAKSTAGVGCYVFNVGRDEGFVIVSADDDLPSVLAYSLSGRFEPDGMPANLASWLGWYEKQVLDYQQAVRAGQRMASDKSVSGRSVANGTKAEEVVAPLLENHPDGSILYDQRMPYNRFCPNPDSLDQPMVTGCVATAMAMIARYHEWPLRSSGSVCYETRTLRIPVRYELGEKDYDWANMLTSYADTGNYAADQTEAVAALMRDMGYSVQMDYTYEESGAYSETVARALAYNMGYSKKMRYLPRDLFADADWADVIRAELEEGRPLYYSGSGPGSGHAFVCDGYNDQAYFHFNWGWSGRGNGWYVLDNLAPTDLGTGSGYGTYNDNQGIVSCIRPAEEGEEADLFIVNNAERWRSQEGVFDAVDSARVSVGWAMNYGIDTVDIRLGFSFWQDSVFCGAYAFDSAHLPPRYGLYGMIVKFNPLGLLAPGNYQMRFSVQEVGGSDWVDVVGSTRYKVDYRLVVGNECYWIGSSGIPETMPVRNFSYVAENGNVLLSWSDPCVMQPDFYRVYLDDALAAEVDSTSVLFTGLENGRYKVEVMAVYEGNVESERVLRYVVVEGVGNADAGLSVFRVYPNPASGRFQVEVPAAGYLRLLDFSGRFVMGKELPSSGVFSVEVPELAAGLYLLEFSDSGKRILLYDKILLR